MAEGRPPWLEEALAGVYVLRGVDSTATDTIVRTMLANYRGPDFGGVDLMVPNSAGEAFLLLGKWTDCLQPSVQTAARLVLEQLEHAVTIRNAGVDMLGGGNASLTTTPRAPVGIVPWFAYAVRVLLPPMTPADEARVAQQVFPQLPGWIGMHMGAPHWLGRGMSRDGSRIVALTPYVRIDLARGVMPGRDGLEVNAMASREDFGRWLAALRAATRWF